jgi:CHAT domain-containing protein/Tfp pilus assembly protein PilF
VRLPTVVIALISAAVGTLEARESRHGLVVISIPKNAGPEAAGIRPGDVLQVWQRSSDAKGKLTSPFDLGDVEINQLPIGPVQIRGQHNGRRQTWTVRTNFRGLMLAYSVEANLSGLTLIRPTLSRALLTEYVAAERLEEHGRASEAAKAYIEAANHAPPNDRKALKAWFLYLGARTFARASLWNDADRTYKAAAEASEFYGPRAKSQVLREWAGTWLTRHNWREAERIDRNALIEEQKISGESLSMAEALLGIASTSWRRGDLDLANEFYRRAFDIGRKLAPISMEAAIMEENIANVACLRGDEETAIRQFKNALAVAQRVQPKSVAVANILDDLGIAYGRYGDLNSEEELHRRALNIYQEVAPDSLEVAYCLNNLGEALQARGELNEADQYYKKALVLKEKFAPNSTLVASTVENLGLSSLARGALDDAENYFERSLSIKQRLQPGTIAVAQGLSNLGNLHFLRRDLDAAEQAYQSAHTIIQTQAPGTYAEAAILIQLAAIPEAKGNLEAARQYLEQALKICQKAMPNSLQLAEALRCLGQIAFEGKSTKAADHFFGQALELQQRLAPGSLIIARTLLAIGQVAATNGHLDNAETSSRRALALISTLAPGSTDEAEALHAMGCLLRRRGDLAGATDFFRRAATALESQTGKLGGTENIKAVFRANFANYYRDCLESLVAVERPGEAFSILERSRARWLLSMLAERDLNFSADAPPELLHERALNAAEYDRTQGQIANLNPSKDSARLQELLAKMRELSTQRDQITARIREASPRLAALEYPQPLNLAAALQILDPGTVCLAYSTGETETILFVLRAAAEQSEFTVHRLNNGEKDLRKQIEAFRTLIERRSNNADKVAEELYEILLRPADEAIAKSARILLIPDGPLQILPFAALRRNGSYLIEWKPLHMALSTTIYSELKKRRSSAQRLELAAFGDPKYQVAGNPGEREEVSRMRKRGIKLEPIPATRDEVTKIAELYQPAIHVFLGADATEEQAKSLGQDVRRIHFATHAITDERFPLNSALVLTIPDSASTGKENGLLQAWEIFEQLRINADLVTLSACETALGQELGGEGLIGLTQAFHYAGARSVLASLWSVEDSSTADLMEHFYHHLKAGDSKDEALRAAQIEALHGTEKREPFYWAGFTLSGDWQNSR